MKKSFSRVISLLSSLVIVLSLFSNIAFAADPAPKTITIFHTNDMHGRLVSTLSNGNLATIGSDYVSSIKKSVPDSLLIDAGDPTQGLPFANLSKGADIITLMNAAGYDGMTLGNHEFDFGMDQALINAKSAKFPVVSANTFYGGKAFLEGVNGNNGKDFIREVDGVKVGFFGITTQETAYKTNPGNIKGVTFADPIQTSKDEVTKLKKDGAEVIVGIMHIGVDSSSEPISDKIAESVPGIDVIIDGHSHTKYEKRVNKTLIVQTQSYSAYIGKIEITFNNGIVTDSKETLLTPAVVKEKFTPDPVVAKLAADISAAQKPFFQKVVGRTHTALWGATVNGLSIGRVTETNLGDLIADAMVDGAKSQVKGTQFEKLPIVALQNGGGIRDSIGSGYITQGQVISVLPFGNILSLKVVTPNVLYEALENGISKVTDVNKDTGVISGVDGRFPQISGMRFEYDPTKKAANTTDATKPLEKGERVTKIVLLKADGTDGKVLDRSDKTTEIVLSSNDFEIAGGDGYTMLGPLKNIGEGNGLEVVFTEYIQKLTKAGGGTFFYPATKNRTKAITSHAYTPYSATIIVKNGDATLANKAVSYVIDNGQSKTGSTDADGKLIVTDLPSGPHSIKIVYTNLVADAYVNDLIGSKTPSVSLTNLDEATAKAVIDMIDSLPAKITASDKVAVEAARNEYNQLTATQKALITNYDRLVKAEKVIKDLTTVKSVTLSKTKATLNIGTSIKLVANVSPATAINKKVSWSSSNPKVATVDANGKVTAKKVGKAIITVKTSQGGKTAKSMITVVQPVKQVKLSKTSVTLKKGKSFTLKATVSPKSASNQKVVWSTSNSKIATINQHGKITAKKKGTVMITVTTVDGKKKATCKVMVK